MLPDGQPVALGVALIYGGNRYLRVLLVGGPPDVSLSGCKFPLRIDNAVTPANVVSGRARRYAQCPACGSLH